MALPTTIPGPSHTASSFWAQTEAGVCVCSIGVCLKYWCVFWSVNDMKWSRAPDEVTPRHTYAFGGHPGSRAMAVGETKDI